MGNKEGDGDRDRDGGVIIVPAAVVVVAVAVAVVDEVIHQGRHKWNIFCLSGKMIYGLHPAIPNTLNGLL